MLVDIVKFTLNDTIYRKTIKINLDFRGLKIKEFQFEAVEIFTYKHFNSEGLRNLKKNEICFAFLEKGTMRTKFRYIYI